ncbi:MAG: peptidylprolyl isomerase [Flavobacteriaceae bacterium]|nr:peptidylprolyl isomerase [Flavobacteriaceae bacterium]
MKDGLYAKFDTSKGEIFVELTYKLTPGTVGNFVGLAEGNIKNDFKESGEPYYNGLKFHRVIPNFMIQGGCPQGTGVAGPGYQFDDEFTDELKHDKPGILSMANAGPGTNGSQFFITHISTNWLDGKHTVFGKVTKGHEIVNQIKQDDIINKIEILRIGEKANEWDSVKAFESFLIKKNEQEKITNGVQKHLLADQIIGMQKTSSGLYFVINKRGNNKKPSKGDNVSVHYKGMLLDGTVFDSSYERNQPIEFLIGVGQVIPGWDEGISLISEGASAKFLIPSNLAYGSQGAGGVIPPDSTLIFEVELIKIN